MKYLIFTLLVPAFSIHGDSIQDGTTEEWSNQKVIEASNSVEKLNSDEKTEDYSSNDVDSFPFSDADVDKKEESLPNPQKIIKGHDADIKRYPYIVSLLCKVSKVEGLQCGGSIISPQHILTAAHCVWDIKDPSNCKIRAGSKYLDFYGIERVVANITIHQEYGKGFFAYGHDIALLKLKSPININNVTTKVIPLMEHGVESKPGTIATAAGWGLMSNSGQRAWQLQYLEMKISSESQCSKTFIHDFFGWKREGEICLISKDNDESKTACFGDSGGPVVIDGKLAGVASAVQASWFHPTECNTKKPNLYTDVSHYRKWIDETLELLS